MTGRCLSTISGPCSAASAPSASSGSTESFSCLLKYEYTKINNSFFSGVLEKYSQPHHCDLLPRLVAMKRRVFSERRLSLNGLFQPLIIEYNRISAISINRIYNLISINLFEIQM